MTAAELGLCFDCQLSKTGVCDRDKILEQVTNAVGITEERRSDLIDEQMKIAQDRGCTGIPGENQGTPPSQPGNADSPGSGVE